MLFRFVCMAIRLQEVFDKKVFLTKYEMRKKVNEYNLKIFLMISFRTLFYFFANIINRTMRVRNCHFYTRVEWESIGKTEVIYTFNILQKISTTKLSSCIKQEGIFFKNSFDLVGSNQLFRKKRNSKSRFN